MSLDDKNSGPEQETAPAPFLSKPALPKRDFDGGLLRRWSYTLTRDDALAWLY